MNMPSHCLSFRPVAVVRQCLLLLLMTGGLGLASPLLAQIDPPPAATQTPDEAPSADQEGDGSGTEAEEQAEVPARDLSDSIPLSDVVSGWRSQYLGLMEDMGLDNSFTAKLIATLAIAVFFFIGLFISRWIARSIHQRLYNVAVGLHLSSRKFNFYYKFLYWLFIALLGLAALIALAATWNISVERFISSETLMDLIATALTIYLMVLAASIVLDLINGVLETSFTRWSNASSSRINTLLPIAKNTVFVVVLVMFLLMLLAEIGINVMPLLAGAGVLGIAVGFGAQTLVKDLITGFIIILEDLIQVGDVAKLADKAGVIERITIRKVQLRDLAGTVYTIPFGEITIVENLTKDFSYAMLEVGIAYREDVDYVSKLLKQISEEMCADEDFKEDILEPLEILGLDKFADSAVVIKARIKTPPIKQWRIMREFNRRMKKLFDELNVEIPFPHRTIYFGQDKHGNAPPLRARTVVDTESRGELERVEDDTPAHDESSDEEAQPSNAVEEASETAKANDRAEQHEAQSHKSPRLPEKGEDEESGDEKKR